MDMHRRSRRAGIIVSGALLAIALVGASAGGALAGARTLFFGSVVNGEVYLSPVEIGQTTAFRLVLRNDSTQTLNQASVKLGDSAPGSLTGATIVDVVGPDAGMCARTSTSLTCDYGQLRRDQARTITVVLLPTGTGAVSVRPIAEINETQGTTNLDTVTAVGSTVPFAPGDDIGRVIPAGTRFAGETALGVNGFKVGVAIARNAGPGETLAILEDDVDFCALGKSCFGGATRLAINFGEALQPHAAVTLTWTDKAVKYAGILHQLDNGSVVDIPNTRSNICKSATATNCIETSKAGLLVFRVPENGLIKGY